MENLGVLGNFGEGEIGILGDPWWGKLAIFGERVPWEFFGAVPGNFGEDLGFGEGIPENLVEGRPWTPKNPREKKPKKLFKKS